jgi:uncharacterized membrane protein
VLNAEVNMELAGGVVLLIAEVETVVPMGIVLLMPMVTFANK